MVLSTHTKGCGASFIPCGGDILSVGDRYSRNLDSY